MLHRITTPGLALVAVALAATGAQAKTVQLTNSGSTTVTKAASGSWTEKTKWGDFGAGYGAGHEIHANYDGSSKSAEIYGVVSGELFGVDFEFVDVSVKAHSGQSATLYGDYYLSALDVTLIDLSDRSLSAPPNSNVEIGGVSFGPDGVSVEKCVEASWEADMTFVGVPLTASAGAAGCLGLGVSAAAEYTASTQRSAIAFTGTPYASIGMSISVGVGTVVASAGAYGEATLIEASIPIVNTLAVVPTSGSAGTMTYTTSGYLTLSSLAGEIGLYVKLGLLKYTYTLFDWSGITWFETLLFTDSVPVAASPKVVINGDTATASYTYTDAAPENGSTITWERATSSAGAGATDIQSGSSKEWNLDLSDSDKYLRFCVVPTNGVNPGEEECSDWQSVGHLLTMYWNTNYGGFARSYAYERSTSGTCVDLDDIQMNWNDDVSSFKFYAHGACTTTLHLYKDADCEGTSASRTVAAGGSDTVNSMTNVIGSGWNDVLSSVRVVYCDAVSASDVAISLDGDEATGAYTLDSASLFDDDESSYRWSRATDAAGSGATDIDTERVHELTAADNGNYLRFCVTPDNGTTSGAEVCSSWTRVTGVTFYWNTNYGGYALTASYGHGGSGTCYELDSIQANWNDDVSSFKFITPTDSEATIWLYEHTGCAGDVVVTTRQANVPADVPSMTLEYGNGWNDKVTSFRVTHY